MIVKDVETTLTSALEDIQAIKRELGEAKTSSIQAWGKRDEFLEAVKDILRLPCWTCGAVSLEQVERAKPRGSRRRIVLRSGSASSAGCAGGGAGGGGHDGGA